MFETTTELTALDALTDASFAASSTHLRSIMTPERRLTAAELSERLPSPAVLNLATVTARGEPRLSAVDGHFLHGQWYFTTDAASPKSRQLRARPAVSVSYTPKDGVGVFCHGDAVLLGPGAELDGLRRHIVATYGQDPADWGVEIAYFVVHARWLTGFAMTDDEMAEIESNSRHEAREDPWQADPAG